MSKGAANEIKIARENNIRVFGEPIAAGLACDGHHICATSFRQAAAYVMSPPIRAEPGTKELLMKYLAAGILQTTGTDNCTFTTEQKALGKDDFRKIPNGVNGVEDRMRLVWHYGVNSGVLTRSQYVAATSFNAAQLFNIPNKGHIESGWDADIVIMDPEADYTISAKTQHHASGVYNIYEGQKVKGNVSHTISRGRLLWSNGKLNVTRGSGRYISRTCFGPAFANMDNKNAQKWSKIVKTDRPGYTGGVLNIQTNQVELYDNGEKTGKTVEWKAPSAVVPPDSDSASS